MTFRTTEIIEYAKLASDVYNVKGTQLQDIPCGWRRDKEHEHKALNAKLSHVNITETLKKFDPSNPTEKNFNHKMKEERESFSEEIDTFFGRLYVKNNYETVIAFRGTVPSHMNDLITDAKLTAKWETSHDRFAREFYKEIMQYLIKGDGINKSIQKYSKRPVLTGHSLGGYLAQLIAVEFGMPAVVFNAPKIGGFRDPYMHNKLISSKDNYDDIINVDVDSDYVHRVGQPIGHSYSLHGDEGYDSEAIDHELKREFTMKMFGGPTSLLMSPFDPKVDNLVAKSAYYKLHEHQTDAVFRALDRNPNLEHSIPAFQD